MIVGMGVLSETVAVQINDPTADQVAVTAASTWHPADVSGSQASATVMSVVIPCLNEAGTISECVRRAQLALATNEIIGEIIVVDNGSTDGSGALATASGALVVHEAERGYGSAYLAGLSVARGEYRPDG